MRYGYWMPVFGGWLRNVEDEQMAATWDYVSRLARRSEQIGFDLYAHRRAEFERHQRRRRAVARCLVHRRRARRRHRALELMVAVRPTFHLPALLAKQAANIDHISGGRLSLNVVSSWWAEEAKKYGVQFEQHDDRYARTSEWLDVVDEAWKQDHFSYSGKYYSVDGSRAAAEAGGEAASHDLRRRRIGSRERINRAEVRRLRDARRSARAHRAENSRHGRAPRKQGSAADAIRRRRLRHRARHGSAKRKRSARASPT